MAVGEDQENVMVGLIKNLFEEVIIKKLIVYIYIRKIDILVYQVFNKHHTNVVMVGDAKRYI